MYLSTASKWYLIISHPTPSQSSPYNLTHSKVNPCGRLYSVTCVNVSHMHWCKSCTAHGRLLDTPWLCYMYAGRLYPLLGSSKSEQSAHKHVICGLFFLSRRHEREDHGLHLPTVFGFQLMVGATKAWRGFLWTSWHQPRPTKQDGWGILESAVYMKSVKKKKKDRNKERKNKAGAAVVCEDTWLQPWNCLLPCNIAAGQWAGTPAKMKSIFVYVPASADHCPLAVNELTLCFNQTEAIWM